LKNFEPHRQRVRDRSPHRQLRQKIIYVKTYILCVPEPAPTSEAWFKNLNCENTTEFS